jgi:hypothetical protein
VIALARALKFAPWIIAGAGVLAALYFRSDAAGERAARKSYEASVAKRIAENNAAVLDKLDALSAKADAATERDAARERAAKAAVSTTISEIDRAPAASDGPVAPVLRDALRAGRLR